MSDFHLTPELVKKVLKTVDAGLSSGLGTPTPGNMCVEAAVCYAMGLPHGDKPTCVDSVIRQVKISLNDAQWSSKATRASGMRRLAVLQLGTKDSGFNQVEFAKKLAMMTITTILPLALTAAGLHDHAVKCQAATTLKEAESAAKYAASAAYYAAKYAAYYAASDAANASKCAAYYAAKCAASDAARCAASSAKYAASSASSVSSAKYAASDAVLKIFATGVENILIEMNVPAVSFLSLIEPNKE